jgi:hypothetical protein
MMMIFAWNRQIPYLIFMRLIQWWIKYLCSPLTYRWRNAEVRIKEMKKDTFIDERWKCSRLRDKDFFLIY